MMAGKSATPAVSESKAQELLRELCLIENRKKVISDELRKYVRTNGPVDGSGLYVDNRQCIYPEVPKPDLLAEVICDLTEPEGFVRVIRGLLEAMAVTTYLRWIKASGEMGAWMQALLPMDEDGGMYTHFGPASIDIRKSAAEDKHNVVLPGEKPLGDGHE